ncbi:hypothetical protein ACLOJK_023607 [Asimina triloba]
MGGRTIQISGFPSNASADMVKEFLEKYTGTLRTASMANQQQLSYAGSCLKTRDGERDIVQKPKSSMFNLEHVVLRLGCQIADDKFYDLWSCDDVEVNFGFGLRKIEFILTFREVHYRLELFYESIWQFFLRLSPTQSTKFLLVQGIHTNAKPGQEYPAWMP